MTLEAALRRGHQLVNLPVLVLCAVPVGGFWLDPDAPAWLHLGVLGASVVIGWCWWSWSLPRWRVWALERVADVDELLEAAVRQRLMWPPGHVLERTEFRPPELRRREDEILRRRRTEPSRAPIHGPLGGDRES